MEVVFALQMILKWILDKRQNIAVALIDLVKAFGKFGYLLLKKKKKSRD